MSRKYKPYKKLSSDAVGWIIVLFLVIGMWALLIFTSNIQYNTFEKRVESGRYVAEQVILEDAWEETDSPRYKTDQYTSCFAKFHWHDRKGNEYYTDRYMVDMYYAGEEHEKLQAGDIVTVYYDSEDPSDLVVNEELYSGKHVGGLIFCIVMTAFFLACFLWAYFGIYRHEKMRRSNQQVNMKTARRKKQGKRR